MLLIEGRPIWGRPYMGSGVIDVWVNRNGGGSFCVQLLQVLSNPLDLVPTSVSV